MVLIVVADALVRGCRTSFAGLDVSLSTRLVDRASVLVWVLERRIARGCERFEVMELGDSNPSPGCDLGGRARGRRRGALR
jgi:hypothetical protein